MQPRRRSSVSLLFNVRADFNPDACVFVGVCVFFGFSTFHIILIFIFLAHTRSVGPRFTSSTDLLSLSSRKKNMKTKLKSMRIYAIIMNCTFHMGKGVFVPKTM